MHFLSLVYYTIINCYLSTMSSRTFMNSRTIFTLFLTGPCQHQWVLQAETEPHDWEGDLRGSDIH